MFKNKLLIGDESTKITWKRRLQMFLSPFMDLVYKFILAINRPIKTDKKYYLSICGIFKDEAHIMREWIEYHKVLGVEHFYLYNNFSTDNYNEVLKPYVETGIVTLIDWPIPLGQMKAYKNCFDTFGKDSQWLAYIDFDEFICPYKELTVSDWLRKYENYPAIAIYWKMFGTSGQIKHDPARLNIEQYTVSWPKLYIGAKVICNTDYTISDYASMHTFPTTLNFLGINFIIPPVNEFQNFLKWNIHRTGYNKDFSMQINHYWSKSYSDYYDKKIGKGSACENYEHTMEQFWWHENQNCSSDYKIYRFLVALKIALRKND
jgi:hypothetical protein